MAMVLERSLRGVLADQPQAAADDTTKWTGARHRSRPFRIRLSEFMGQASGSRHSGLMLPARITLLHFSVSSAMSLLNSAGELSNTVPPKSVICAFILL